MAGGLYAIQMMESLNLNSFYGQHAVYELYTLVGFSIGLLEIRYISQKLPAYLLIIKFSIVLVSHGFIMLSLTMKWNNFGSTGKTESKSLQDNF